MKLQAKQFPAYVKDVAKSPGILLYGVDEGQVREKMREIISAYLGAKFDPLSLVELDEDILKQDSARLNDELFALNMFGDKRLVVMQGKGEALSKTIQSIYSAPELPQTFLVVVAGELDSRSALRKFFEMHPSLAAFACYHDETYQVDALIKQKFAEAGIQAGREVVAYLASQLGNDRRVTLNEIEKVILYCHGQNQLSLEEAMQVVGSHADLSANDFVNAVADGQGKLADRIMEKILREGGQPIQLLRMLQNYYGKLHLYTHEIKAQRTTIDSYIQMLKPPVFFKQVPVLKRHLSTWNEGKLTKALAVLLEAERLCKETGSVPEVILGQSMVKIVWLAHYRG